MTDVVITGVGCVTPVGTDVATTWDSVTSGETGTDSVRRHDASAYPEMPDVAAEVDADPAAWDRVNTRRMGRHVQFAVKAAEEALTDADLDPGAAPGTVGTSVGNALGGAESSSNHTTTVEAGDVPISTGFLKLLPNMAGGYLSIEWDAAGPARAPAAACAAGAQAVADAVADLRAGRADAMIAGGTEAPLTPMVLTMFNRLGGLSTAVSTPETACRPFDVDRDGTVFGEGSGILVLETRSHARERGAAPLATVEGFGLGADASHPTRPPTDGDGMARTMNAALADADCDRSDVGLVAAHATGTPVGDASESTAIQNVFADTPPVTGLKGTTGHLLAGSTPVELTVLVRALQRGVLPPTATCDQPDDACDVPVVREPVAADPSAVMANAAGFGGTNCSVVLGSV
jgi:3-oxoacyl-[acyl-carrier-protein] synthase II